MSNNLFYVYLKYTDFTGFYGNFIFFNLNFQSNSIFFSTINYVFVMLLFFFVYTSIGYNFFNLFVLDDQNIGPNHDFIFFILFNFVFLCYNLVFSVDILSVFYFYVRFFNIIFIIFYLIVLLLCLGFYLILFIKGAGQSKRFLYTLLMDFIQLNSFFIRVTVQFIRIVMIYGTLYMFYLGWSELSINNYFSSDNIQIIKIIFVFFRVSFEIIHTLFVVLMQTALFIFLLVWLFQFFLYSFSIFSKEL